MRKMIISSMLILLALGSFVACGKGSGNTSEKKQPKIITVWNYYNGAQKEAFDSLVQTFNETVGTDENIMVEAVSKGTISELAQALQDSADKKIGSDPLPQICAAYADDALKYNRRGLLADLDAYMTQEELDEYVDAYLEEGYLENKTSLKLFPTAKSTEVLIVNMTDWERFAADTGASLDRLQTWEGIARLADDYYQWSDGKAFFGRDAFANYMMIGSRQLGHEIFRYEKEKIVLDFDKETMRKLWDNYYVPYIKGHYTAAGKFRSDDLKTGNLIAFAGSTSGATYTPSAVTYEDGTTYPITCQVFPLPNFEGTRPCAVQQGAGMMVLKSEEETEAASMLFLKWFTDTPQNMEFCLKTGYLPVKKEANQEEPLKKLLAEHQIEISPITRQSFETGIKEAREYDLYTSKAFKKSYEARGLIETGMSGQAQKDREEKDALIAGGMSVGEAEAKFLSDENFEQWYSKSYQILSALGE